jgi:hypothetical protein
MQRSSAIAKAQDAIVRDIRKVRKGTDFPDRARLTFAPGKAASQFTLVLQRAAWEAAFGKVDATPNARITALFAAAPSAALS